MSGGSERPFDAAKKHWVTVSAAEFFFEPYCTELKPVGGGRLVVVYGDDDTRHRGVEVALLEGGAAAVWVPASGRVFWLPELADVDEPNEPWETRLREFDHKSGTPVAAS
jgi:hypothetical protein